MGTLKEVAPYRPSYLTGRHHQRYALIAHARRLERTGQIIILEPRPSWNGEVWELAVQELRRPRVWPKWALGVCALLLFLGAVFWVMTSLSATALGALCLAALALLALLTYGGRRPSVTVTTITQTTIR